MYIFPYTHIVQYVHIEWVKLNIKEERKTGAMAKRKLYTCSNTHAKIRLCVHTGWKWSTAFGIEGNKKMENLIFKAFFFSFFSFFSSMNFRTCTWIFFSSLPKVNEENHADVRQQGLEVKKKINYIRTNEIKITNIIEYATLAERGRKRKKYFSYENRN